MSEFENKVIEKLAVIEKQQSEIIEILSKSIDMAVGADSFNVDFIDNKFLQ